MLFCENNLKMNAKLVFIVLCSVFVASNAKIKCYSCSFATSDSDQSCLTVNTNTPKVDCDMKYCTITRQEYVDPKGVVASFVRGCSDRPDFLNTEITDTTHRTFYRACTIPLCNVGNGIQSVTGGDASPYPVYIGPNLLVPGTGSNAAAIKVNLVILLICFLCGSLAN